MAAGPKDTSFTQEASKLDTPALIKDLAITAVIDSYQEFLFRRLCKFCLEHFRQESPWIDYNTGYFPFRVR